ncbi:hypothetical protein Ais01nite_73900 [Asanoa ishikariensis]|uniref:Uncharacterized protein n=1 Tax=Asanoa ishikariensis TaxID=137265 RepID=A0A1H3US29_9ACTN|nr:hypothetical protein Ais01nite_73900 [Asanoa ishikariensis]SDZ65056.1 hypothetical protein SAMN05421684_7914 [Asanoa ishikariensis]
MGKHEAVEPKRPIHRRIMRHALHPVAHILALVSLHSVALLVVEKSPLLALLIH